MEILKVNNISKDFGSLQVIKNLNFSVKEHSIFGFIGKNGAGKTTTMKMILGFLKPDQGDIYVCGEKVIYGNTKTNKYIGYLPDVPEFYGYMTPMEYLKLCGEINGFNSSKIKIKSKELLELVGLCNINRKISGFSRGMKQRLGIAAALINEPKLLICDEPTSALDPIGRKDILDILLKVKDKTTIVFSTHILSDVERIADTIGILNKGELALNGNLYDIKDKYREDRLLIEVCDEKFIPILKENISKLIQVKKISIDEKNVYINLKDVKETSNKILQIIASENIPILKYEILEPSLENVFLEVVE